MFIHLRLARFRFASAIARRRAEQRLRRRSRQLARRSEPRRRRSGFRVLPALAVAALTLAVIAMMAGLLGCAALVHAPPRDPSIELRPAASATAAPPSALRVITYNVHGISGAALTRALKSDAQLARADVLLLQEVARAERSGERLVSGSPGACSAACAAGRALGMTSVFAPGHQQDGGTSGVAILSRRPLRDAQIIELPYRHAVVNSARRIALAATVDTAAGPLRLIAVHLENRINPAARISQLAPALEHARAFRGAVILGGDMNTSPFSWLGHLIPIPTGVQDDRLGAAVRAAGLATPVADVFATSKWLSMRLDAIYTRGVTPGGYGVAQAVRASDHLPLWLDVKI